MAPILAITALKFDLGNINEMLAQTSPGFVKDLEPLRHIPAAICVPATIIGILGLIALYVAWLAIAVRRLHDMGVTGWLVLILAAISLVFNVYGGIVTTLVLGIWPSSRRNRYGLTDARDVVGVFDDRRPAGFTG